MVFFQFKRLFLPKYGNNFKILLSTYLRDSRLRWLIFNFLCKEILPLGLVSVQWRHSGLTNPKYATLVYWLSWDTGTWKTTGVKKALWPPLVSLNAGDETPMWKMPSLYQEERNIFYHQRRGCRARETCTNGLCESESHLPEISLHLLVTFPQLPLCSTWHMGTWLTLFSVFIFLWWLLCIWQIY